MREDRLGSNSHTASPLNKVESFKPWLALCEMGSPGYLQTFRCKRNISTVGVQTCPCDYHQVALQSQRQSMEEKREGDKSHRAGTPGEPVRLASGYFCGL